MIIGVGTDIIEVDRIEKAIEKTSSFFDKIYTAKEQAYYKEKHKRVETLAGFFSAKEAVSKALGTGFRSFGMKDIEIIPNALGKPQVYLYNQAKELAEQLGIKDIHISISHCRSYATAFAIAEGGEINETIDSTSNKRD